MSRVLIACEFSGIVRDSFIARGHDAWSCDILPTERPGPHLQCDVLGVLDRGWDLMIAHPPCTHLSVSGARWFASGHKPLYLREQALDFVRALMAAPISRIAIENPVSVISSHIRKSDQVIHPWQHGHPEQKATCLWLKGLPKLVPTRIVRDEMMQLPIQQRTRIHYLGSSKSRERSITYTGIAEAFANQWGGLL